MERLPIVVYGATGYTGRLIVRALDTRGVRFAIAGRDREKLEALAHSLKSPPYVVVAGVEEGPRLVEMAAQARVVLDCAGPFVRYGRPVLEAALAAGSHFLDITGEPEFMRYTWSRHDEAMGKGVALVNAVGFDVVPTDCAACIAAEAAHSPVAALRVAVGARHGRNTRGTVRSVFQALGKGGLAYQEGAWREEKVAGERWAVHFPQPVGTRECVSVPLGDVVTAPRSTGAQNVRAFFALPRALLRWTWALDIAGRVIVLPLVRGLAERWVKSLPEGPTPEQRADAHFACYAEAVGPRGSHSVWVTGGDGYEFTAASASLCATLAASEGFQAKGALTPAQAFGARALLDGLAGSGLHWGQDTGPV